MSVFTSLVVGGLIGWLARMLVLGPPRQGMAASIVIGAAGALLCSWLVSPLVGFTPSTQDSFNMMAVALAVGGAVGMLGIVDFARRLSAR